MRPFIDTGQHSSFIGLGYPRLTRRFGGWQVAVVCLAAVAGLLLLMGLTQNYVAYLALRFLLGAADTGVFIISETWINQMAPQRSRGRVVGLYATSAAAGFSAGPLILSVTGVEGMTSSQHILRRSPRQGRKTRSLLVMTETCELERH